MNLLKIPVLIVGAGPVGLATALELGWRGVKCLIIDYEPNRAEAIGAHPRAAAVSPRSMEFCRRWGIADQVRESGFPKDFPPNVVFCTAIDGHTIAVQKFPAVKDRKPLKESPEQRQRCPQMWFDPLLEAALSKYPSVQMRRPWQLDSFEDRGTHVEAMLTNLQSGEKSRVDCDYMVACDGPRSTVREHLGIESTGKGLLSESANVIMDIPDFLGKHDKGPAERYIFLDGNGTWGNMTCIDGRRRWRFTETLSDRAKKDPAAAVRRALGPDIAFEVVAVAPWRRRDAVACRFQSGRVFLAGDAAHTIPPNLGMGMNTGVGDAVDLGWKLDAALNGWAGPNLLASYDAERRPVAVQIADASTEVYKIWMTTSPDHHELLAPGEKGASARVKVGEFLRRNLPDGWDTLGLQLGYRYEDSPICVADGTPPPVEEGIGDYVPVARPGSRAPHAWLADGRSTIDLFGRGFVLLDFGADKADVDAIVAAARSRKLPCSIVAPGDPAIAELYDARLVMVRPDGHVAWRGNGAPASALEMIDRIRGA